MAASPRLPSPSNLLVVAARVTLILSFLACGRVLIAIYHGADLEPGPRTFLLLSLEFALGMTAGMGAIGLTQKRPWGLPILTLAAAAGLVRAAAFLWVFGRHLSEIILYLGAKQTFLDYGALLLICLVQALWCPILLVLIFIEMQGWDPDAPYTRASKRMFWAVGASTTAAFGGIELLMRLG